MKKYIFSVTKVFIILIVTLLCIYLILAIANDFSRLGGENILVPNNFVGFVYIVYDEKQGESKKENGVNTYKIPTSAVYTTNLNFKKRLNMYESSVRFYYVDSTGKRLQLPNCCSNGQIDTTLAENAIAFSFKNIPNTDSDELFNSKPYFAYQIDSMKNLGKKIIPLTKIKYLSSKK